MNEGRLGSLRGIRGAVGITALALLLSGPAGAELVYDATSPFTFATRSVGKSPSGTINQIADAFVMSGSGLELESVTVKISRLSGDGDFAIRFWADELGLPGELLETWSVSGAFEQSTEVTVDSTGGVLLDEGELYWVSVALPDDLSWGLWVAIDAAPDGKVVAFSNGETPNWYDSSASREGALFLRVTAVREPGKAGLGGVSVVCLGALARSRRMRRAS